MITRRSLVLVGSAFATIVVSFITQWYLLTRLGATRQLDAYFAALAVPMMLVYVVGEPLFRVAVPSLAILDSDRRSALAWSTFRTIGVVFLVTALVIGSTARWWVTLLTPGFTAADQRVVATLVHVLVGSMFLQGVAGAARTVWHARERFQYPALVSAFAAIVALAALVVALPRYGVAAAAWAFNLRFFVEFVALIPALGLPWRARGPRESTLLILRRAQPLILGAAYARTDVLVDRVLSSLAPAGSLSLLYLAQQILAAIGQVLNQSFVAPIGPSLATQAHAGRWREFRQVLRDRTLQLASLLLFLAVLLPILGKPVLQLLLQHRNMRAEDVSQLVLVMIALSGLLIGDSLGFLMNTTFYSVANTRTPAIATGVVYSLLVPIKIGAFLVAGIIGLALSTSAYYVLNAAVLAILLRSAVLRLSGAGQPAPMPVTVLPAAYRPDDVP